MSIVDRLYSELAGIIDETLIKLKVSNEVINITEVDKGAKKINIFNFISSDSNSIEIDSIFLSYFDKIFSKKTTSIYHQQHDYSFLLKCDGIIIYQKGDYLILNFIELKDTLNFRTFAKAISQIEASHFKIKLILDILESINIDKVTAYCMIISTLPEDSNMQQQNIWMSKKLLLAENNIESELIHYYKSLIKDKEINFEIPCTNCCRFLINPKFKFNNVPIRLIEGNNQQVSV